MDSWIDRLEEWRKESPLIRFRQNAGMGQKQLAALLNVSLTSVRLWEQGASKLSDESLFRLQTFTGITEDELEKWYIARPRPRREKNELRARNA